MNGWRKYGEESKLAKKILGYDANLLYLYCSGDVIPYGKETACCSRDTFLYSTWSNKDYTEINGRKTVKGTKKL